METISNIANAAVEAVWPSTTDATTAQRDSTTTTTTTTTTTQLDNAQEPLSGVLGNPQRGEPYDAGNMAEQDAVRGTINLSVGGNDYANTGMSDNININNYPPAGPSSEAAGAAGLNSSRVPSTGVDDGSSRAQQVGLDSPAVAGLPPAVATTTTINGQAPQTESHGQGTGEKYIRSTGLLADGGDFDAAREGAGREADRLLEEKGVIVNKAKNKGPDAAAEHSTSSSSSSGRHEKKSLGEKIKEKLHK